MCSLKCDPENFRLFRIIVVPPKAYLSGLPIHSASKSLKTLIQGLNWTSLPGTVIVITALGLLLPHIEWTNCSSDHKDDVSIDPQILGPKLPRPFQPEENDPTEKPMSARRLDI